MSYYVIIRGPLGVGKSTVSKGLAKVLGARYISVDRILDECDLWSAGRLSEFLRANEVVARRAGPSLKKGTPVVLDGNFYWKTQVQDLERRLDHRHFVFTMKAPLKVCIERDAGRAAPHGRRAAREVFAKSTRFQYGFDIDATQPVKRLVGEIAVAISAGNRRLPRR